MTRAYNDQRNGELSIDGDFIYDVKKRNRRTIVRRCVTRICSAWTATSIDHPDNLESFGIINPHANHQDKVKIIKAELACEVESK